MQNVCYSTFNLLFPIRCLICGRRTHNSHICSFCKLPSVNIENHSKCHCCFSPIHETEDRGKCRVCSILPSMFERIRFLYSYNDEKVARFINCMKYRPSLVLAKKAGRQLGYNLSSLFEYYDWDLLLPIPSAPQSIYERRFNQCAVFIREICHSHTHLSGCFSALKHRGYKNVQASLNAKSRIHNVKNSFYAEQTLVANKKILLIDDVVTTGATSQSAARAIADAGAASIDLLSFARSDNWQEHRYAIFKNI